MNYNISNMPAYVALRIVAVVLAALGIALLSMAGAVDLSGPSMPNRPGYGWLLGGALLLILGVAGPVRIMGKGAKIPAEVRRMILVQALVLPLAGISLMAAGIARSPTSLAVAYFFIGAFALVSALAGFYSLSRNLPATLFVGEMLAIIKSTGLTGDKADSPVNREFERWTGGLRDGVPVGQAAPDGNVITMDGEPALLSSYFGADTSSPLVLNFASYTCPHHRKRIDELHLLMNQWENSGVRFLTVYTAEAHPQDGWKLDHQYDHDAEYTNEEDFCFYYARSIDDRLQMARWLIEKKQFKMSVVLDSMENNLLKAYNSWPIRLYIISNGKVAFCGEQGPFGYTPDGVDKALRTLLI